jgi:lipopolysaccharide export system protein LptA
MLLNRSILFNKEGKSLTGDTIFYDKSAKYGEVFGNAILKDTVQQSTLYGNYVYYNEDKERGIATDSALLVDWSTEKHMYMHADTLMTFKDSIYNEAKAWRNVRFYREDIQGLADSLIYSSRDSIMHLMNKPVLWQENQQYSSEKISIMSRNQEVYQVELQQSAMVTELMDSLYFNQISGKDIIAHLDSSQIRRVDVNGNAETIYFIREESDSTLIGANRTESSFVVIHFKNKKIDRIVLTPSSSGEFHPIHKITDEFVYLTNFFWLETHRPMTKDEVFSRFPDEERPKFSFREKKFISLPAIPEAEEIEEEK